MLSVIFMATILAFSVMLNLVNNRVGFRDRYYMSDVSKVGRGGGAVVWEGWTYLSTLCFPMYWNKDVLNALQGVVDLQEPL